MKTHLLALTLVVTLGFTGLARPARAQNDYVVGPQDVLTITVFGEADLSRQYTVEQDGTFTFPLIGRVKAGGLTLRGVEQELKTQLADGYLKNPQVTVAVEQYKSQQLLVLGEVRNPGPYKLTGGMTLLQALAQAGSTTPVAAREAIIVRPSRKHAQTPGGEDPDAEVIRVDLSQLQAGNLALNVALLDGDTVTVPKAQSVFVSGHVKNPGPYQVERDTTVLQVLSMAGGLTERGSDGRIKLQRTINGKLLELKAKLTDPVLPGDTIIVPERFF